MYRSLGLQILNNALHSIWKRFCDDGVGAKFSQGYTCSVTCFTKQCMTAQNENLAAATSALNSLAKHVRHCLGSAVVGERRIRGEVGAEAPVDCIRVRMPE